jgi:hypothetical protein
MISFLRFPHQIPYEFFFTYVLPVSPISSSFEHPNNIWWGGQVTNPLVMQSPSLLILLLVRSSYVHVFSSSFYSWTPSVFVFPLIWETKFHTHIEQQKTYISVRADLYVFRKQTGGQTTLNRMARGISRIYCLKFLRHENLSDECRYKIFESSTF